MMKCIGLQGLVISTLSLALAAAVADAQFLGGAAPSPADVVKISASFTASASSAQGQLAVTATIKPGWHIYSNTQAPGGPTQTKIDTETAPSFRQTGAFRALNEPDKTKEPDAFGDLDLEMHRNKVTWVAPVTFVAGTELQKLQIKGKVFAQPCKDGKNGMCLMPTEFPYAASFAGSAASASFAPPPSAAGDSQAQPPVTMQPGEKSPTTRSDTRGELPWQRYTSMNDLQTRLGPGFNPEHATQWIATQMNDISFLREVILGFLGGIFLNLMPCVLPVLGLKILSFIEQAGQQRQRIFMLNAAYSLGLLAVFALLAALAVSLNLGWGHLFKFSGFNVVMAAIVFAMGLSFLGVWEIPIPGFVGRGKAVELAQQEGLSGAFIKGGITTILATPCTGPFMGSAVAWALRQPAIVTFVVFLSVGLGMASPYLLVGAFPRLIRFLPRPGAWMETFKQLMGFLLLGTVVFIFSYLDWPYVVPTLGFLFAIWFGCWWVARTPATAETSAKARAWVETATIIAAAWFLMFAGTRGILPSKWAFGSMLDVMNSRFEMAVEERGALRDSSTLVANHGGPPSTEADSASASPVAVLVDCTADWCPTCKVLEATVLESDAVRRAILANGVVTLRADWTHSAPEVTKLLKMLGSQQVPQVAIFSGSDPNHPRVFRDGYTQQQLLDAIEQAGTAKSGDNSQPPGISKM